MARLKSTCGYRRPWGRQALGRAGSFVLTRQSLGLHGGQMGLKPSFLLLLPSTSRVPGGFQLQEPIA